MIIKYFLLSPSSRISGGVVAYHMGGQEVSGRASGIKPVHNQSCGPLCCGDPEQGAAEMEVL